MVFMLGAMLMSPGPLDKGLDTFFAVTPIPPEWTPEQKESYLREDNKRMLRLLTIHEAVPGHYLQLAYSNRCPSLIRNVFTNGVFVEGWAVWVTQLMIDEGYDKDDLGFLLTHWKFYLRAVTNSILDIGIHLEGMTRDEAMKLMVEGGFQEESEASAKWDRACLTSTQLCEVLLSSERSPLSSANNILKFLSSIFLFVKKDFFYRTAPKLCFRVFISFVDSILISIIPVLSWVCFGDRSRGRWAKEDRGRRQDLPVSSFP